MSNNSTAINHKHILSMLQKNCVTVGVVFIEDGGCNYAISPRTVPFAPWEDGDEPQQTRDPVNPHNRKVYTYKANKGTVAIGNYVNVLDPNNHIKVCQVVRVDDRVKIDLDYHSSYKWIIGVVQLDEYQARLDREEAFNDGLIELERGKQERALVEEFKEQFADDPTSMAMVDELLESANVAPIMSKVTGDQTKMLAMSKTELEQIIGNAEKALGKL